MFFDLAHDAADKIAKAHPLYTEPAVRLPELVKKSDPIIHHTFDAGEGVLIPGEILHHAAHGCRTFVILQPFGCLPNHVVGRGISKRLKELYPDVQILPLDYDPDVSSREHREPSPDADHECEGTECGEGRVKYELSFSC